MQIRVFQAIALAALLAGGQALASSGGAAEQTDARAILAQQAEIRADAQAGKGRYRDMKQATRDELFRHQDQVQRLLEGAERTTDLPQRDQLSVFNALEAISAIVNQAEDDRMICERIKPIGSNRATTVCKSVAQRRQERENAESTIKGDKRCTDAWGAGMCRGG